MSDQIRSFIVGVHFAGNACRPPNMARAIEFQHDNFWVNCPVEMLHFETPGHQGVVLLAP